MARVVAIVKGVSFWLSDALCTPIFTSVKATFAGDAANIRKHAEAHTPETKTETFASYMSLEAVFTIHGPGVLQPGVCMPFGAGPEQ